MITLHFIAADGSTRTIEAQPGQSLMQAATAANVNGIEADCGGTLSCATCHVVVRAPWHAQLPTPDADESGMLEFTACPRQPASRLACQIQLTPSLDGLTVDLPERQH